VLIEEITASCHLAYANADTVKRCVGCTNNCQGSCEKCLEGIHYVKDDRRYNCPNIVNYYVCKYSFRYATEVETLLGVCPAFDDLSDYRILSVGCGPCTDLFAFESSVDKKGSSTPIDYRGVDLDETWKPIHTRISNIAAKRGISTRFSYTDVLNLMAGLSGRPTQWVPNILSLQYVLSDMANHCTEQEMLSFLDDVQQKIVSQMPTGSIVLLNDINLSSNNKPDGTAFKTSRHFFDRLHAEMKKAYKNLNRWTYHFKADSSYYRYGTEHDGNGVLYSVSDTIKKSYNPWLQCRSAQMVIKKGAAN